MNDGRRDDTKQEDKIEETNEPKGTNETNEKQDKVEQELEQLKTLVSQLDNNYKRALADYQNLQRRTQEERAEWIGIANKGLILKFLEVLDTLRLAQKHIEDKGLDLSIDKFDKVLESEGVKRIDTLGKNFDPNTMEAVSTREEKGKSGKVVEELRAGYVINDEVLRAAQVIVGQ